MKVRSLFAPGILCLANSYAAVTVNSAQFGPVTNAAIDTTGVADWGFVSSSSNGIFDSNLGGAGASYNNTSFGSLTNNSGTTITTVGGTSPIGSVTLTEGNPGAPGTDTVGAQTNIPDYTFGGTQAYGAYGNFAPSEQDIWTMDFNNLGVGQFLITLYLGHTASNRVFDMDITGTEISYSTDPTTVSPQISTLGSTVPFTQNGLSFTYEIDITTSDATDSLTLVHGGISGGTGGGTLSGYTIVAIPEPGSSLLLALSGLLLGTRRRR